MNLRAPLFLLGLSLRRRRGHHLALAGATAAGAFVLTLAVVGGLGGGRVFQEHLGELFPSHRVLLRPRATNVGWLQFESAEITTATVAAVRAAPGVRRASPEATIRFPVSAVGSLLGLTYGTDITATGVESWLVGGDAAGAFDRWQEQADADPDEAGRPGEIPVALSGYFLDLYNTALAESNSLPKLSESAAVGRHFTLVLGESSIRTASRAERVREEPCRIVGLTRNPDLIGLTLPLRAVESLNEWWGLEDRLYRAIHVELQSAEAVDDLQNILADLGLEMHDSAAPWRRLLLGVRAAGFGFFALGLLVFGLALAYMASAVGWGLMQRRRETGLCLALGATVSQARAWLVGEVALVCGLGLAAGVGAGAGLLGSGRSWYVAWRAGRGFLPEGLLAASPWAYAAVWGVCLAVVALVATVRVFAETRRLTLGPLRGDNGLREG